MLIWALSLFHEKMQLVGVYAGYECYRSNIDGTTIGIWALNIGIENYL